MRYSETFGLRHAGPGSRAWTTHKRTETGVGRGAGQRRKKLREKGDLWFVCSYGQQLLVPLVCCHCMVALAESTTWGRKITSSWFLLQRWPSYRLRYSESRGQRSTAVQHFGSSKALVLGVSERLQHNCFVSGSCLPLAGAQLLGLCRDVS